MKAHKMVEEGKSIEELSDTYIEDLRKQLGPNVEVDDLFRYEWTYIPHIYHTPFYCYAYAFGNLLTLALWDIYKEEGEPFIRKIEDFLAAGGSKSPTELASELGIDLCDET